MHLLQQLDQDWSRLVAGGDAHRACLRWRREEPVLSHVTCAEQLVQQIRTADHPSRSDELLSALVQRAPTDDLAARAVLQALIPGLTCLIRSLQHADLEEVEATVLAAAWFRIRTYPHARRPHRVAANILLDTRKESLRSPIFRGERLVTLDSIEVTDSPSKLRDELGELLQAGIDQSLISREDARLISVTRTGERSIETEAGALGVRPEALRKRRARAEHRLQHLAP